MNIFLLVIGKVCSSIGAELLNSYLFIAEQLQTATVGWVNLLRIASTHIVNRSYDKFFYCIVEFMANCWNLLSSVGYILIDRIVAVVRNGANGSEFFYLGKLLDFISAIKVIIVNVLLLVNYRFIISFIVRLGIISLFTIFILVVGGFLR
jgi:hypothetical protein